MSTTQIRADLNLWREFFLGGDVPAGTKDATPDVDDVIDAAIESGDAGLLDLAELVDRMALHYMMMSADSWAYDMMQNDLPELAKPVHVPGERQWQRVTLADIAAILDRTPRH